MPPLRTAETPKAGPWAVRLRWTERHATLSLRLKPGLLAGRDGDAFWLRGHDWSEDVIRLIQQLPGEGWFCVQTDGQLVRVGSRVPSGRLPALDWRPFEDCWELQLPPAALPGRTATSSEPSNGVRVPLRLERTDHLHEADALLVTIDDWSRFATQASSVRLKPLRFAVCADGRCLVRGQPVPPLPGTRLWSSADVLVPCGYTWVPEVDTAIVRQVLDAGEDSVLWHPDGTWERLTADQFVHATRSAVRATGGTP